MPFGIAENIWYCLDSAIGVTKRGVDTQRRGTWFMAGSPAFVIHSHSHSHSLNSSIDNSYLKSRRSPSFITQPDTFKQDSVTTPSTIITHTLAKDVHCGTQAVTRRGGAVQAINVEAGENFQAWQLSIFISSAAEITAVDIPLEVDNHCQETPWWPFKEPQKAPGWYQ